MNRHHLSQKPVLMGAVIAITMMTIILPAYPLRGCVGMASSSLALSRLLQLASPMLPVGAYSYSQGLEWAIESGDVHDLESAKLWISDALHIYQGSFELPVLHRLYQAWQADDMQAVNTWDAFFQAGRDTAESLAETKQMGYSLCRLLNDLNDLPADFMVKINELDEP